MSVTDNSGNTDNGAAAANEPAENAVQTQADAQATPGFRLPTDIHLLAQMRDQLADYLGTLERNTDAVNEWLMEEQDDIILSHHQLNRAIRQKDEATALGILKNAQAQGIAGFLLSLQDFTALSNAAFGENSALSQLTAAIPHDPPEGIIEELPVITLPDEKIQTAALIAQKMEDAAANAPAEEPKKKKGFWSSLFSNSEKKEAEEKARLELEKQQQEEEARRRWRAVKEELISLQSDRHYYVDSFMDWVGESLAPEKSQPGDNISYLMDTYQDPQYVIDAARHDYDSVIGNKTEILKKKALEYSEFAKFIDEQDINAFTGMMPKLFGRDDLKREEQYRRLLLRDMAQYGQSFVDLSLNYAQSRDDQFRLLESALKFEDKIVMSGQKTPEEIFGRIFKLVIDEKNPMNPRAISLVVSKLEKLGTPAAQLINNEHFAQVARRFAGDAKGFKSALKEILSAVAPKSAGIENVFVDFIAALDTRDAAMLSTTLVKTARDGLGMQIKALFAACYPNISLLDRVIAVSATAQDKTKALSLQIAQAVGAGVVDDFKVNAGLSAAGSGRFFSFFEKHGLAPEQLVSFDGASFRQLLGHSLLNGGLDNFRSTITAPNGWLAQVASSGIDYDSVNGWIAAMLEPFASDITRANILFEAGQNATGVARDVLLAMEEQFASRNVRLSEDKILANIETIPNIWYNNERNTILFTMNGTEHVLMEGVSDKMAEDILSYIRRKGDFMAEFDGLFRPDNIDRIVTRIVAGGASQNTEMFWRQGDGALHATKAQVAELHKRTDFLTETLPNEIFSVNRKSITLLQPRKEGYLLVDKYGEALSLVGKLSWPSSKDKPFIQFDDGTLFNPENASIMRLDHDKKVLRFRIESLDFEDFLKKTDSGEYQYSLHLSPSDMKKVEAALESSPNIAGARIDANRVAYFNFSAIGYMMHEDKVKNPGFQCLRYSTKNKPPGFIPADDALAEKIKSSVSRNENIITVENLMLHKNRIDDAYYNPEKGKLYVVVGTDILQTSTTADRACNILQQLSKEPRFDVVGATDIQTETRLLQQAPADVLCNDKTVLYFYNTAGDKPYAMTADKDIELGLSQSQMRKFMDRMERDGIADNSYESWVCDLRATLARLQPVTLGVSPSLLHRDQGYILDILNGKKDTQPLPKASEDFSIAAGRRLQAGSVLTYPQHKTQALPNDGVKQKKPARKSGPSL